MFKDVRVKHGAAHFAWSARLCGYDDLLPPSVPSKPSNRGANEKKTNGSDLQGGGGTAPLEKVVSGMVPVHSCMVPVWKNRVPDVLTRTENQATVVLNRPSRPKPKLGCSCSFWRVSQMVSVGVTKVRTNMQSNGEHASVHDALHWCSEVAPPVSSHRNIWKEGGPLEKPLER